MVNDYEKFKKDVFSLTNIDLNAYKERQMKRRIDTLISKNSIAGYNEYISAMNKDSSLFHEFINYITINVSEFYRNPEQWALLEKEVFPQMLKNFGSRLKIWSAACSTGDEPYSLAMVLSRLLPLNQIRIIATDIDKEVLAKAKVGLYNEKSIKSVPDEFKKKYFTKIGPSYQISDDIKRCVEFREHNLLEDPYPGSCNLIVCRNVLIYFTEEAKNDIYLKFNEALKKDGILFIGSTEQIIQYRAMNFERYKSFFYQKS